MTQLPVWRQFVTINLSSIDQKRRVVIMPAQWVEDLTISGTPEECAAKISAFHAAGADSVALFPIATDRIGDIVRLTADTVLPDL